MSSVTLCHLYGIASMLGLPLCVNGCSEVYCMAIWAVLLSLSCPAVSYNCPRVFFRSLLWFLSAGLCGLWGIPKVFYDISVTVLKFYDMFSHFSVWSVLFCDSTDIPWAVCW